MSLNVANGSEAKRGLLSWYALQVWVRKEALVATQLQGQGLECFLPKYKSVRQWSDRKKELEQPLFPGYLFCRFNYTERRPIVVTPGVLQVVGNGRIGLPVEDKEVEAIQLAVGSGIAAQPWPFLEIGERVRIHTGKLSGLEGILVNFKGNHRVVLSVALLQRSVALEIDLAWVGSLETHRRSAAERALAVEPVRVVG
jgi:transcription antitermination factor NusG